MNYNLNVHSIDNPGAFQQEGYRLHKYQIVADSKNQDKGTTATDIVIFRYADVLMMKAECLLRLGTGDDGLAAELVTRVRKRSFGSLAKATRTAADLRGGSVYAYGHEEYTTADEAGYNDWVIRFLPTRVVQTSSLVACLTILAGSSVASCIVVRISSASR